MVNGLVWIQLIAHTVDLLKPYNKGECIVRCFNTYRVSVGFLRDNCIVIV